jgi:hypothetical protein
MRRGTAGKTHCGRWTPNVPEGIWATRLVCSKEPKHKGRHFNEWSGCEWADGETPRLASRQLT